MLDLSFWRDDVVICHQNPQFCNNERACPKKITEVTIFSSGRPDRSTSLVLDVLSSQKKISDRRFGHPLSFCFALVHEEGRCLEEQERVERGGCGGRSATMFVVVNNEERGVECEDRWLSFEGIEPSDC